MSAAKFRRDGKTAVVTGAGSGIGLAIARAFAAAGASVHLVDISGQAAETAAHELVRSGATAWVHACDVSDHDAVAQTFAEIHGRGPVHRLVNSAGVAHIGNLANTPEADFDRLFRVNVKGCYLCMQAVIDEMQAAGEGAIELSSPAELPEPAATAPTATDPIADLEVDDQFGNGTEVAVTSVLLGREPALLVITDMTGQVLGVKEVSTRSQPTQVKLQTPVTTSQELIASLYLDDGNGRFNPADTPMLDEENEPVSEDFDYVVQ